MIIQKITNFMGIDNNTFWTNLVTILIWLIPFLGSKLIGIFRKKEDNRRYWEVEKEYKNEIFYDKLFIFSLGVSYCIGVLYLILVVINIHIVFRILIILILWGLVIVFLNNRKSVRVNLLRINRWYGKILIYFPIIFITTGVIAFCEKCEIIEFICIIMSFGCEVVGLIKFSNSYTVYKHSLAKIILNTSQQIDEIDVSKMYKKGDWIVFWKDNNKNLVLFESIVKIEYYGEPKYVIYKF